MASQERFERNLRHLGKRSPWIVDGLRAASREAIEEVEGPRGARVLSDQGVLLASAYNPDREAEKLAAQLAEDAADIVVAVGFGLGLHFEKFKAKSAAKLVIYEPSAARLRAALELSVLHPLFAKHDDVFVAQDLDDLAMVVERLYIPGLLLRLVLHPAVMRIDANGVRRAAERVRRVKEAGDTKGATSVEKMIPWSKIVAQNGQRVASSASFFELEGVFAGRTAVVVAAGPSLDQHIELLRERADEVVIIAIGQTAKTLQMAGIRPDLVHVLESRNVSHQLTDGGDSAALDVVLFPDCHPALFDVPTRNCFVATSKLSPMGNWIAEVRGDKRFVIGGGTVAQSAVGLAWMLGASRILLIGQDLAFSKGRVYAKNSAYDFVGFSLSESGRISWSEQKSKAALLGDRPLEEIDDRHDAGQVVWVDAWHEGERVQTWRSYASFIEHYREIGVFLESQGIEVINCTEGGARIPSLRHIPFREALDEGDREPVEAASVIAQVAASARRLEIHDFKEAMDTAERRLVEVEKEAKKGLKVTEELSQRVDRGADGEACFSTLRALAKREKRLKNLLGRIQWFDVLVQPEIYASMALTAKNDRANPELEDIVHESRLLFKGAKRGIQRARLWFEAFEASFSSEPETRKAGTAPSPHRRTGWSPNTQSPPPQEADGSPSSPAPAAESAGGLRSV